MLEEPGLQIPRLTGTVDLSQLLIHPLLEHGYFASSPSHPCWDGKVLVLDFLGLNFILAHFAMSFSTFRILLVCRTEL